MKIFQIFFCTIIIMQGTILYSQVGTVQTSIFNVETGTNKYYFIQMEDGSNYHVRIVSVDNNKVLLMNPSGGTFTIATNQVKNVIEKNFESKGSVGIGFGIPYGVLGINADIKLYKNFYCTAGIGTCIYITPMFNIGSKLYLRASNHQWRPRLSLNYGNTSMIYVEGSSNNSIRESFTGFSIAIGQQWTLGITRAWGIDCDILYILDDSQLENRMYELENAGYEFDVANAGNIKVSIGLRYCF
jgi:hypothetical protein